MVFYIDQGGKMPLSDNFTAEYRLFQERKIKK
jgi:hypothetical protein